LATFSQDKAVWPDKRRMYLARLAKKVSFKPEFRSHLVSFSNYSFLKNRIQENEPTTQDFWNMHILEGISLPVIFPHADKPHTWCRKQQTYLFIHVWATTAIKNFIFYHTAYRYGHKQSLTQNNMYMVSHFFTVFSGKEYSLKRLLRVFIIQWFWMQLIDETVMNLASVNVVVHCSGRRLINNCKVLSRVWFSCRQETTVTSVRRGWLHIWWIVNKCPTVLQMCLTF